MNKSNNKETTNGAKPVIPAVRSFEYWTKKEYRVKRTVVEVISN